jgi:hypothetical protein
VVSGPYGVNLWKYISKGWETFSQFLEFKVGGSRIRFWSDVWCGVVPLKVSFPEFYRITRDKEAYVANHLRVWNDVVHWEMDFIQLFYDRELESVPNFLDLLYSISTKGQGANQSCWKPSGSKIFQVRSFYYALSPTDSVFSMEMYLEAESPA